MPYLKYTILNSLNIVWINYLYVIYEKAPGRYDCAGAFIIV
jgi:hypothetical protein